MWYYKLYTLNIQTTIELPNIKTCQITPSNNPDVTISVGKVTPIFDEIHYIKEWDELVYTVGLIDNKITTLINFKGIARYLVQDGQTIVIDKLPMGTVIDMESYLLSLALSSLLFQREYFLLHASTIVQDGKAYVFLGSSGSGKTSTTVGLMKRGCTILAEDVTVLKYVDGIPYIVPGIPYVKLLRDVASREGFVWDTLDLLYADDEKRAYQLDKEYETETIPLQKIYALTATTTVEDLELSDLEGEDKFAAIAMNIHYPHFFEGYPIEEYYTNIAYQLMDEISFKRLERPQGKDTLSAMLDMLQNDFALIEEIPVSIKS